jgi:3',5'-cyclic AMP phosphodiesterase CpdA
MPQERSILLDRPFVLAHLSDLHISLEQKGRSIRSARRLLESILRHSVDHLVISGDITANGTPHELEIARSIFESYGLLDTRKLSLVIGNHDVFGGVHTAEDVLSFPRRCKHVDYDAALRRFCDVFHELFRGAIAPASPNRFPFVKVVGRAALFGINSVARYARVKNPFGSNGAVGRMQRNLLENLLHADVFRSLTKFVLIHHHFSRLPTTAAGTMEFLWRTVERRTLKLRKKKKLVRLFAEAGVAAVLHGHVHESVEYEWRGVRCLNGGGSVIEKNDELSFWLVRVHQGDIETRLHRIPRHRTACEGSAGTVVRSPAAPHALRKTSSTHNVGLTLL